MTTKRSSALLIGMAVLAAATACSSGSSSDKPTDSGNGAAAPTGSPIVLFASVSLSGPAGVTPGVKAGAQIAVDAINAAGGIKGHPLKFIACDVKGTPAGSQACGQQAVQAKAVAIINSQDAFGGAITATDAAGIPTIGNCVCSQPDALLPTSYPTVTGPTSQAAQGTVLAALGAKTVSAAVFDGAAGDTIAANVNSGLKPFGQQLEHIVKIPTTAGDLSPYVAQLKTSEGINLITAPSTTLQLLRELKKSNYQGKIVTSSALVTPKDLSKLGAAGQGVYVVGGSLPSTDQSAPGVAAFNADVSKFGGSDADHDGYSVEAWATIKMLAKVMDTLPTVTAETLTAALKSAGQLQVEPMVPVDFGKPVSLFSPVREFNTTFYLTKIDNGKFVPVSTKPYDITNPPKTLP